MVMSLTGRCAAEQVPVSTGSAGFHSSCRRALGKKDEIPGFYQQFLFCLWGRVSMPSAPGTTRTCPAPSLSSFPLEWKKVARCPKNTEKSNKFFLIARYFNAFYLCSGRGAAGLSVQPRDSCAAEALGCFTEPCFAVSLSSCRLSPSGGTAWCAVCAAHSHTLCWDCSVGHLTQLLSG